MIKKSERKVNFMADCSSGCGANGKKRIFYACSGAADVGQIADLTARHLAKEKFGAMSCLAGVGAGLPGFLDSAKEADSIVIDGCTVSCGKKMFEQHGLPFTEFVITEQGVAKGASPATPEIVERMADALKASVTGK